MKAFLKQYKNLISVVIGISVFFLLLLLDPIGFYIERSHQRAKIENQIAIEKAEVDKKIAIIKAQTEAELKRIRVSADAK